MWLEWCFNCNFTASSCGRSDFFSHLDVFHSYISWKASAGGEKIVEGDGVMSTAGKDFRENEFVRRCLLFLSVNSKKVWARWRLIPEVRIIEIFICADFEFLQVEDSSIYLPTPLFKMAILTDALINTLLWLDLCSEKYLTLRFIENSNISFPSRSPGKSYMEGLELYLEGSSSAQSNNKIFNGGNRMSPVALFVILVMDKTSLAPLLLVRFWWWDFPRKCGW